MDKLHSILIYVFLGMPVWAWAIVAALVGANELMIRYKNARAIHLFQGALRLLLAIPALGALLKRSPILGDVLMWCAGLSPLATAEADALKAAQGAVDKQRGFVALPMMLIIAGLTLAVAPRAGCSPGAQAIGKCELGAMPTQAEAVIAAVSAVLANTSDINWTGDLETLGLRAGPSLVDCVVVAVTASAQAQMPAHGQPEPMLLTVIQRGQIWAKAHPAKCCAAGAK